MASKSHSKRYNAIIEAPPKCSCGGKTKLHNWFIGDVIWKCRKCEREFIIDSTKYPS